MLAKFPEELHHRTYSSSSNIFLPLTWYLSLCANCSAEICSHLYYFNYAFLFFDLSVLNGFFPYSHQYLNSLPHLTSTESIILP